MRFSSHSCLNSNSFSISRSFCLFFPCFRDSFLPPRCSEPRACVHEASWSYRGKWLNGMSLREQGERQFVPANGCTGFHLSSPSSRVHRTRWRNTFHSTRIVNIWLEIFLFSKFPFLFDLARRWKKSSIGKNRETQSNYDVRCMGEDKYCREGGSRGVSSILLSFLLVSRSSRTLWLLVIWFRFGTCCKPAAAAKIGSRASFTTFTH